MTRVIQDISPLFAVEAEQMLNSGFPEEAVELCESGLEIYPDYPAAYSVLVRSYINLGNFEKANKLIEVIIELFPENKQIKNLHNSTSKLFHEMGLDFELESGYNDSNNSEDSEETDIIEENILLDEKFNIPESEIVENLPDSTDTEQKSFLKSMIDKSMDIANYQTDIKASNIGLIPGLEVSPLKIDTKKSRKRDYIKLLHDIPDDISISESEWSRLNSSTRATGKDFDDNSDYEEYDNSESSSGSIKSAPVVSETLAGIYEIQGAYSAALSAYEQLISMYPEKADKFKEKIDFIKNKV